MPAMTERFEMRLSQSTVEKVDSWRSQQTDFPSRAEAVRRLVEVGLNTAGGDGQIKFGSGDKLILSMLCEIYKQLQINGGINPEFVQAAIDGGHYWGLKLEYPGIFHNYEDKEHVVSEVVDVLEMWSFIESGFGKLSKKDRNFVAAEADPFGQTVIFTGFDGNYESEYLHVARFFVDELQRFSVFKGRDLNSHVPLLDAYRRMLGAFEPMRLKLIGRELNATEIVDLLKVEHPRSPKS